MITASIITTSVLRRLPCATIQSALMSLALWTSLVPVAQAIENVSEGYLTPQTISLAPNGFGAFGGYYFIPDFARASSDTSLRKIWAMPPGGGPPTLFATNHSSALLGGIFLPDTGWGINSGRFLTTGRSTNQLLPTAPFLQGQVYTYDSSGAVYRFAEIAGASLSQPRIAPSGFGSFSGKLIMADDFNVVTSADSSNSRILALDPNGRVSVVATIPDTQGSWGLAFAPADFGAFGGKLFVSNAGNGSIILVDSDGTYTPFANLTLATGQDGLRQMEFSPPGFIPGYGSLLFVSISGSTAGGGTLGDVVAIDSNGYVVQALKTDLGLTKFDPRGLLFTGDGKLLISDSSDPMYFATALDFQKVPEPTAAALVLMGSGIVLGSRRLKREELPVRN